MEYGVRCGTGSVSLLDLGKKGLASVSMEKTKAKLLTLALLFCLASLSLTPAGVSGLPTACPPGQASSKVYGVGHCGTVIFNANRPRQSLTISNMFVTPGECTEGKPQSVLMGSRVCGKLVFLGDYSSGE